MNPIPLVGELLELPELVALTDPDAWWEQQERIEDLLAARFKLETTQHWLEILDAADLWCAPVLTLEELVDHDGFRAIEMTQNIVRDASVAAGGAELTLATTRSPIRIDGHTLTSQRPAPKLGQHNAEVFAEFGIDGTGIESTGIESTGIENAGIEAAEAAS
jgi:crotonobetainyl-CoA:carnitine CoA-transferase CaiB-like acyl-CoA transferase